MRRLINWFPKTTSRPARKHRARLGLTPLEAREVPAAVLANGVLTVNGDDGNVARNDTIEVFSPVDGSMVVRVNGVEQFSGSNAINRVVIDGRAGSDQVRLRGVQTGITNGVRVQRSETVTMGVLNPTTGLVSMADIRSDVRVENATNISLQDTGSTANRTIVIGEQEITGLAPGRISYGAFANGATMSITSGRGADTFQIDRTPGARTHLFGGGGADTFDLRRSVGDVQINGQAGADVINIATAGQSLSQVFGRVTVNDGSFQDRVTIDDRRTAGNDDFFDSYTATLVSNRFTLAVGARTTLDSGQVISRSFNRTINLNGVDSVDYRAATREANTSRIDIQGVNRLTETRVDVGGVETTRLGSAARTLNGFLGRTTLVGGQEGSELLLDDAGQTTGRSFRVSATRITQPIQLGERLIDYGTFLGRVEVEAGSGNDQFTVDSHRADDRPVRLDGNGGIDFLTGLNQANDWSVAGVNFGSLNGRLVFLGVDSLTGRTDDDTFRFGQNGRLNGRINGGGGFDTLDYSARTTGVNVNLGSGAATGAAGGVTNIRNVFGGSAADALTGNGLSNVLAGNGGVDVLNGGTGSARDVLIGGTQGDLLTTGGTGDTLYVGGDVAAADRNNVASMKAIMAEWTSANPYATRVANLATGVGAGGSVRLSSAALDADNARDEFRPRSGQDVFYRDAQDVFSGGFLPAANEQVISV